ncbi:MAG: fatty acid desaturase [Solirubrobacteraceae bacterium]|nr:fatty acid desaturase [Solirubrobacteraceae bacterium]
MSRLHRNVNIAAVVIPFVGLIVAIVLLWGWGVTWVDLGLMAFMYVITGLGITVGYHRMLTHRSFQTSKPVEYTFAILGSMAIEGSPIEWVADHRKHHAHSDQEGDPHSPHAGFAGGGLRNALRGLYHAHIGWLFVNEGRATKRKYAPDLLDDPGIRWISRRFPYFVLLSLAIPAVLGGLITWSWKGALTGLLWGGFVRIFFLHHVTWSVNSICHFLGNRPFQVDDHSGNVFWLAIPSLGEAWHHNHHAFPRSAVHGLRSRRQIDISAGVIWAMEKLGLVWNVVRIPPERQAQKLVGAAAGAASAPARETVGAAGD